VTYFNAFLDIMIAHKNCSKKKHFSNDFSTMKFTVAVAALLMAPAYGFAPNAVPVRQVSTLTSRASIVKVVWVLLP
jgi:hypothetical protein